MQLWMQFPRAAKPLHRNPGNYFLREFVDGFYEFVSEIWSSGGKAMTSLHFGQTMNRSEIEKISKALSEAGLIASRREGQFVYARPPRKRSQPTRGR
jgi:hypothetical protein